MIERDGRLLVVVEAKHTQGQGRASGFVQLEARDVRNGSKYVERLSPSDKVERVTIERVDYTFLYNEGKNVVLMDPTTFEQARRHAQRNATRTRTCSLAAASWLHSAAAYRVPLRRAVRGADRAVGRRRPFSVRRRDGDGREACVWGGSVGNAAGHH